MFLQIILQLLKLNPSKDSEGMDLLSKAGLQVLNRIQKQPTVILQVGSKAVWAFDPHITRRLHNFMPTRQPIFASQADTWTAIELMFSGWTELSSLLKAEQLRIWEVCSTHSYIIKQFLIHSKNAGYFHAWNLGRPLHKAFIRSLTQVGAV